MQFIDAQTINQGLEQGIISIEGMVDALYQGHLQPRASAERLAMAAPNSDAQMLISPAWQESTALGVKLASIFPQNAERNLPREHGVYLLFDPHTGQPATMMDAGALTPLKTAADSALAAKLLANLETEQLLQIGSGPVAESLLRAHLQVRPAISRVRIWSRNNVNARQLAERLTAQLSRPDLDIQMTDDLQSAVGNSQMISAATPSTEALICGDWLQPGSHVDLVGSFTPQMREADSRVMQRGRIYVDSRELTIEHCGDLVVPVNEGIITAADIRADLAELCQAAENSSLNRLGRQSAADITVFKNAGGPHLDLMAASYIAGALSDN